MKRASFEPFTLSLLLAAGPLPVYGQTSTVAVEPMPPPTAEMVRLAQTARDADLRGDWNGLLAAHEAFEALAVHGRQQAWVDYYLGYVDWRQSSLAYMGEGWTGWRPLLRQAGDHLAHALELVPELTEARLLLAIVDASQIGPDPRRAPDLAARMQANADRALAEAPTNPRVRLMSAMLAFFSPDNSREEKDRALKAWRDAAESFGEERNTGAVAWGGAESWAWLGGAILADGNPAGAKAALERALADRSDFWWARDIALPQASNSRLGHRGGR